MNKNGCCNKQIDEEMLLTMIGADLGVEDTGLVHARIDTSVERILIKGKEIRIQLYEKPAIA